MIDLPPDELISLRDAINKTLAPLEMQQHANLLYGIRKIQQAVAALGFQFDFPGVVAGAKILTDQEIFLRFPVILHRVEDSREIRNAYLVLSLHQYTNGTCEIIAFVP